MSAVSINNENTPAVKVPRVYITNLDYHTTEEELEDYLKPYNVYAIPFVLVAERTDRTGAVF